MARTPLSVTGSSTRALKVWPANDKSTSIGWVRRMLITVPLGTTSAGACLGAGDDLAGAQADAVSRERHADDHREQQRHPQRLSRHAGSCHLATMGSDAEI